MTESEKLPECCYAPQDAEPAHQLYAAYNKGGERPGLNYQNLPCPLWADLPADVVAKWRSVAALMLSSRKKGLDFSLALNWVRNGYRVRRALWPDKAWIARTAGTSFYVGGATTTGAAAHMATEHDKIEIATHIDLSLGDGRLLVGWMPSSLEMFATDWEVIDG
jgi:hypothetical protein